MLALGLVGAIALVSVPAVLRPSDEPGAVVEVSGPMPVIDAQTARIDAHLERHAGSTG